MSFQEGYTFPIHNICKVKGVKMPRSAIEKAEIEFFVRISTVLLSMNGELHIEHVCVSNKIVLIPCVVSCLVLFLE